MIAADLMTENPRTIRATDPLGQAIEALQSIEVRHLPVVDDQNELVGMLSDRDLGSLMRTFSEGANAERLIVPLSRRRVAEFCCRPSSIATISSHASRSPSTPTSRSTDGAFSAMARRGGVLSSPSSGLPRPCSSRSTRSVQAPALSRSSTTRMRTPYRSVRRSAAGRCSASYRTPSSRGGFHFERPASTSELRETDRIPKSVRAASADAAISLAFCEEPVRSSCARECLPPVRPWNSFLRAGADSAGRGKDESSCPATPRTAQHVGDQRLRRTR